MAFCALKSTTPLGTARTDSEQLSCHASEVLTYVDLLAAGGSSPAGPAGPAVVTREVAIAAAGLVEEADGPLLAVIAPIVDVLGAVGPRVHRHRHAPAPARGHATPVSAWPKHGEIVWAAHAAPQGLHGCALSGELSSSLAPHGEQ